MDTKSLCLNWQKASTAVRHRRHPMHQLYTVSYLPAAYEWLLTESETGVAFDIAAEWVKMANKKDFSFSEKPKRVKVAVPNKVKQSVREKDRRNPNQPKNSWFSD